MEENLNNPQQQMDNAGCIGVAFSVLFPLVGLILYVTKKDSVNNPKAYLYASLAGFVIGTIGSLLSTIAQS